MKRVVIILLSALLFYAFFRQVNGVVILLLLGGLGFALLLSRVPEKTIAVARYPFIGLSLAASVLFCIYPQVLTRYHLEPLVLFVGFYGLALYLANMEVQKKGPGKELAALLIITASLAVNLALAGKPFLALPVATAMIFFFFIMGRVRLIPVAIAFAAAAYGFAAHRGLPFFKGGMALSEPERYLILAMTFLFLLFTFIALIRKGTPLKVLAFFGFLYVATDVLLAVGFQIPSGLLSQPVTALLFTTPLVGAMLGREGGFL
jgi:hypothetical protein